MHRGTPARHRGQGKGARKGSTGPHRGRPRTHTALGKSLARALSGLHVSGTPQVRPQSLLHRAPPPGYFCLLSFAARPTVRAPVLLSAWPHLRLRHQRPHSMGFPIALGSAQSCLGLPVSSLTVMDSALAGYLSSDEETPHHGPLGKVVSGDSILLPPELVFSGDPLGCLTCYASSEEDQTDRGAPAASADQAPAPPGVAAWSDPTDEHASASSSVPK